MSSPKRLARIAGLLYLVVGIFGGFAGGYAPPKVYVAGNPARTAENILANSGLVRFSVVADLLHGCSYGCISNKGNLIIKLLPRPSSLSTSTVPPWSIISSLTTYSPTPNPLI